MNGMELWENIYDSVAVKQAWLAVKAVEYVGSVQMNYGYVHICTVQPHYNSPHYKADFIITRPCLGSQMLIFL